MIYTVRPGYKQALGLYYLVYYCESYGTVQIVYRKKSHLIIWAKFHS